MQDENKVVKDEQGRPKSSNVRKRSEKLHRNSSRIKGPKTELQGSEAWYRALFDNANDAIFLVDHDRFIGCNPKTLEIFGCTKEQIIGQRPYDRFSPRLQPDGQTSRNKALEKIRAALDGQPQFFEWRHLRYDGTPFEAEVSLNRVEISEHFYLQAFVRDITKQKHSRLQYEMILKTAMDGFGVFSSEGKILEVNSAYCNMVGYSREELLSMNLVDIEALESAERIIKHIEKLMDSGSHRFETRHKRKDGTFVDLEISANCFKLDDNRIFAFFRDITERKKAEAELRQERDRAQKYLDVAGVIFVALDKDGKVSLINQKGCEILCADEENIIGKNWFDNFLPKEIGKKVKHIFEKLMTGELISVEYYENSILTISGEERQIAWHNTLLKDENGRIVGTLSSGEDITKRKEAEQKLRRHEEQLKSLASELSLAEERERRRIAAGIHDDIAQRLALAKLELQSIQNTISDSNVILSLKNQCGTIDAIMEDARSLTFELSNPLLYEIGLETAIESFLTEQIQEKFGIKCKFTSQGPQLSLDEDIRIVLYQGARELLTNIVKHANASRVEVRIVKSNTQVSIIIEDNGIGLNLSKLSSPERDKGGFGLFNIRERLEYLGGNLDIQSIPNKGTCVTMSIPLKLKVTAQQEEIVP